MEAINNDDLINYYNFNEDASCISIGTKTGFKIITCNPFTNHHNRKFNRGIGIVEIYHSSNILALTGCENNSIFPCNKLVIWDDNKEEILREIRFSLKIRVIKIIKDKLFIVNDLKILILNFENLSLINSYELYLYKKELISFSVKKDTKIAYCSENKKQIYIINIETKKEIKIINKNDELDYEYLQFNSKGDILAAACEGKVILYKTSDGEIDREINNESLKNGCINCMCFSNNDKFLAVSTIENNSGNINIFDMGTKEEKGIIDYFWFSEDKCFSYYNLNCKEFIFRFDKDDSILIMTSNAEFIKISIDKENGGNCKKVKSKNIFN